MTVSRFTDGERTIARFLNKWPKLRSLAKSTYQRISYSIHGEKEFRVTLYPALVARGADSRIPVIGQTTSKAEEFFGYYDKSPWSPNMEEILVHRWEGGREVSIIAYGADGAERHIGTTEAWNFQQGAMAQWMPGDGARKIIFNTIVDKRLISVVVDSVGYVKQLPWPIQVLHPNRKEGLTLNYRRLYALRAEYGYASSVDNFSPDQSIDKDGIWKVDLTTGDSHLIVSLRELIAHKAEEGMGEAKHKVNHLLYSPLGRHAVFVHRWFSRNEKRSRLYVMDLEAANGIRLLLDERMISHYTWKNDESLLVWGRHFSNGDRYYLVNVKTGECEVIGLGVLDQYGDGHPSFSPDRRWILTDTYPDRRRQCHLLLFDVERQRMHTLGRFLSPLRYAGANRVDLHPRWSPDGNEISIDSAHDGVRRSYILDVRELMRNNSHSAS